MAQDWPWDPCADEASLSVCIAGLCRLTLGLEHRLGADHTNRSLFMPPTNQHSVGLCAVIGHLPLEVKTESFELGTWERAVRARGTQTLRIWTILPDECSVCLRPGSHCQFALWGAED